ncbi:ParA family protein [Streptomyces mirabilis]
MSFHVLVGVPRPAWQIKKAAVRHPGRQRAARAPPVVGLLADARTNQRPFHSGDQAHVNENTRHKTLAAATEHVWDAFVIVVGMLKGGTGKTTSAWFIALYYAVVLNLPTLLLDADSTSQSATKIERRKLVATFDEAERAAARNEHGVTAHVVMVKADDRTSLPGRAKDQLLDPGEGEGIGPDRDEAFPLAETTVHSWVHYMEAFGEIPTELSEYANLMKELTQA